MDIRNIRPNGVDQSYEGPHHVVMILAETAEGKVCSRIIGSSIDLAARTLESLENQGTKYEVLAVYPDINYTAVNMLASATMDVNRALVKGNSIDKLYLRNYLARPKSES